MSETHSMTATITTEHALSIGKKAALLKAQLAEKAKKELEAQQK